MATGKILHSVSKAISAQQQVRPVTGDKYTDLFEHVIHRIRRDAMATEVDESYLLESIHDFVGRPPLLGERVCMSVFAEVD